MPVVASVLFYADDPSEAGLPAQRSVIRHIRITFDSPGITVAPGDVAVVGTDTLPTFTLSLEEVGGVTVLTLTFAGYGTQDGYYTLSIYGFADTPFFRFFGDVNGDSQVDNANDYPAMHAAYRSRRGMSNYRSWLDFDGDGFILLADFAQFNQRLNYQLNSDGTLTHL